MSSDASNGTWQRFLAASKKKKGPLYTRHVNRNVAIPLTYVFWRLGAHPNTVSVLSFAVTHTALALLIVLDASWPVVISAWLLLALGYVMDSCDGQLARLSGKTSRLGEWLDHSLDMVKILNFNMMLSFVMISHAAVQDAPLWLPFLAAFLNLLSQPSHFFVINMKEQLLSTDDSAARRATQFGEDGRTKWAMRFVLNGADYGLYILIVLLIPRQDVFVPVYLAYGVFYSLLFLSHFARTSMMMARVHRP